MKKEFMNNQKNAQQNLYSTNKLKFQTPRVFKKINFAFESNKCRNSNGIERNQNVRNIVSKSPNFLGKYYKMEERNKERRLRIENRMHNEKIKYLLKVMKKNIEENYKKSSTNSSYVFPKKNKNLNHDVNEELKDRLIRCQFNQQKPLNAPLIYKNKNYFMIKVKSEMLL